MINDINSHIDMSNFEEIECFNGNNCDYYNCKFTHVGDGSKCIWGLKCDRRVCEFKHPTGYPVEQKCSYGNDCGRCECSFAHGTDGTEITCKWGMICNRHVCMYKHVSMDRNNVDGNGACKYDNECRFNACQYVHGDNNTSVDCKWMRNCTRTTCNFNHIEKTNYRKCPRGPSCKYYKGRDNWCKLVH